MEQTRWESHGIWSIVSLVILSQRIHGAAIYGNIYHQYTPVMLAYIPYMDPMGIRNPIEFDSSASSYGSSCIFCEFHEN